MFSRIEQYISELILIKVNLVYLVFISSGCNKSIKIQITNPGSLVLDSGIIFICLSRTLEKILEYSFRSNEVPVVTKIFMFLLKPFQWKNCKKFFLFNGFKNVRVLNVYLHIGACSTECNTLLQRSMSRLPIDGRVKFYFLVSFAFK